MRDPNMKCELCGTTLAQAEEGAIDCQASNDYEHAFPGLRRYVVLALASCTHCHGKGVVNDARCECASVSLAP